MRGTSALSHRRAISGVLVAVMLLIGLLTAQAALAQGGDQPTFQASTYASADGTSSIQSQEAQLTSDFLAASATLEGTALRSDGIALAQGQTSGVITSGAINSPLGSVSDIVPIWSAELPTGSQLKLETRLSQDGSTWSNWAENPVAYFPVRENQYGGTLIWVGGGQASLQFRATMQAAPDGTSPVLRSVTLTFSNTQQGPTDSAIASQMGAAESAAGICPVPKPPVVSRIMWGCPDGEFSPRRPPEYQSVTHIIIHHTATPNNPYQDWSQVVRSVWNYHANILWWGDVGYNYLIDPNGVIFEGRAGGDDVVGIHDNFNRGSMAVGFIGCYGNCGYLGLADAQPSPTMLDAGANLMAWQASQKGLDPRATTQYDGAGIVPVIAGGRDVTATFSPGDLLYGSLPWLRETVAQRSPCGAPVPPPPPPMGGAPLVVVEPERLMASWCSYVEHSAVTVMNAVHLRTVALEVTYDPHVVQVVDADPYAWGVQVSLAGPLMVDPSVVTRNEVDTTNGRIFFEANMYGSLLIEGTSALITIDWRPQMPGATAVTIVRADMTPDGGTPIPGTVRNGSVEITPDCVAGTVMLQGRSDYSGITIVSSSGAQATTDAAGKFTVSGGEPLTARVPGFLSATAGPGTAAAHASATGDTSANSVGTITLLAGDLNQDDVINIFDLALIAGVLDSADASADLNADGVVNIMDVALIAGNYGQQGPQTDWQ
jgi:hypothetical protein